MQTHKFFFSSLQHLPHKNKKTPKEAFYGGGAYTKLTNYYFNSML